MWDSDKGSDPYNHAMLDALLDSWARNNTITVNLLRAIPEDAMDLRPMDSSPTIAKLFVHLHYVRLVFVEEDAPAFARETPKGEWVAEPDRDRLITMLNDSAKAVSDAVTHRLQTSTAMGLHYDHPLLMFQHLIWHEGYHHGQIKLTLKLAGRPLDDRTLGRQTWGVWMDKGRSPK